MARLSVLWTKHIREPEQKESFEKSIFNSQVALNRLREIFEEDLQRLLAPTETDYESPSWSHLQAHKNGKAETIRKLLDLLEPIKR